MRWQQGIREHLPQCLPKNLARYFGWFRSSVSNTEINPGITIQQVRLKSNAITHETAIARMLQLQLIPTARIPGRYNINGAIELPDTCLPFRHVSIANTTLKASNATPPKINTTPIDENKARKSLRPPYSHARISVTTLAGFTPVNF